MVENRLKEFQLEETNGAVPHQEQPGRKRPAARELPKPLPEPPGGLVTQDGITISEAVKPALTDQLSAEGYATWFGDVQVLGLADHTLWSAAPDRYTQQWISVRLDAIVCMSLLQTGYSEITPQDWVHPQEDQTDNPPVP